MRNRNRVRRPVFLNTLDAFIPEVWAQESLMILEANMVAANLVHRDFENEIAQQGDTVNTRLPAAFAAVRKVDGDAVTNQNASATNVPVLLNQHLHTSFIIYDGERSKGAKYLRETYLVGAIQSIADAIDSILLGCVYQFGANKVGKLGTDLTKTTVIQAREVLNTNKVPVGARNLIVTPNGEGSLLGIADFTNAEKVGDEGTIMREGSLGRKFGFNIFMCQNTPSIATGNTVVTGAVNYASGYGIGTTTLVVNGFTGLLTVGSWCTIASDMIPQLITAQSAGGGSDTVGITISPGLASAVVHTAVISVYTPGAINFGAGYDTGYGKSMVINGFSVAPKKGQLISSVVTSPRYAAYGTPTTTGIVLNCPLEATVAHASVLGIGPKGEYNFAFDRDALALVMRPLEAPDPNTGVKSYVASYNGLGLRVTIGYDMNYQGMRVTVDALAGVKVLDANRGCVVYS